ncbi:MAG: N-acetyl-gamma-glutamyl-phosphate reductase [candidate division KSB1 bacterium]|nr:N-acetyl-gamma-glutamyl-phosphate reductase [candidate division KSB1 bacterium]
MAAIDEIRVAIAGVTGYTGAELVRYLSRHASVKIVGASSESLAGETLGSLHPSLYGPASELQLVGLERLLETEADVFFLCLPHGQAAAVAGQLAERGKKVIDLSADFRLPNANLYRQWYGVEHPCPQRLAEAAYGLSELYREQIRQARVVANPGCYPTAALLALSPLLREGLVSTKGIVIDAKSGLSGAGKTPKPHLHFVEANESVSPYNAGRTHRHVPEIDWYLTEAAGEKVEVLFTPHLVPMDRGILETIYVRLREGVEAQDLLDCWREAYRGEAFVRVLPKSLPCTKRVAWTNVCELGIGWVGDGIGVLVAAIDNLGKGASGQAVQNLNILFGLDEREGLG